MDIPVFDFTGMDSYLVLDYHSFDSYEDFINASRNYADGASGVDFNDRGYTQMEVVVANDEGGRRPATMGRPSRSKRVHFLDTQAPIQCVRK